MTGRAMRKRQALVSLLVLALFQSGCTTPASNVPAPGTAKPTAVRFDLYTHCGLSPSHVMFEGGYWIAAEYLKWNNLDDPYDRGSMTLLAFDRAQYTSDRGTIIIFTRLPGRPDERKICA